MILPDSTLRTLPHCPTNGVHFYHPPEVIGPANILITVMALIGLIGAVVAFKKGASGQLLYASVALNSVALLADPMTNAIY
jgi:hypothetical protein